MAMIKLKVLNARGETLAVSPAGSRVSLVHTAPYQAGDWIALECGASGMYCVIQLEDSMPPALVYIKGSAMDFPIPPADNRVNYSPKSFTGSSHLIRARTATVDEITTCRNLALNPYDCHGEHGFFPTPQPMWRPGARRSLQYGMPLTGSTRTAPTVPGRTRAGASTGIPEPVSGWISAGRWRSVS